MEHNGPRPSNNSEVNRPRPKPRSYRRKSDPNAKSASTSSKGHAYRGSVWLRNLKMEQLNAHHAQCSLFRMPRRRPSKPEVRATQQIPPPPCPGKREGLEFGLRRQAPKGFCHGTLGAVRTTIVWHDHGYQQSSRRAQEPDRHLPSLVSVRRRAIPIECSNEGGRTCIAQPRKGRSMAAQGHRMDT